MFNNGIQIQHDDFTELPSLVDNFFEGWPSNKQKDVHDSHDDLSSEETSSYSTDDDPDLQSKRRNSVQLGHEVMNELVENDNVAKAVHILQRAIDHLQMTQTGDGRQVSKIYSQIIKLLCDKNIIKIVNELSSSSSNDDDGVKEDINQSIIWRLFTKVVEAGYVLEREAHLAVVKMLVDKHQTSLALQAIYTLPRQEWDTACYRTAILLHLMQEPQPQIQEAQGLLTDYGKPYLEFANPIAPQQLPPIRREMPLMDQVTEQDHFKLWMFYQAALSDADREWHHQKLIYEKERKEVWTQEESHTEMIKNWAMDQLLHLETRRQQIDRKGIENDNTMIFVAIRNNQFEYGWQIYKSMKDSINEATPYVIMHLCWMAFREIPIMHISRRTHWEARAWSVYSRFMCSEYLHPEESKEMPGFLHDILSIAANSPEGITRTVQDKRKRARYTKCMTVYQLLVRLQLDTLLCHNQVLEPILCTLLYECKGSSSQIVHMCNKGFEIWDRKLDISRHHHYQPCSYSIIWSLLILCLKSGSEDNFDKLLRYLITKREKELRTEEASLPSSLLAPVQAFHDTFICYKGCYFYEYMFRIVEFTDQKKEPLSPAIFMDHYGFLHYDNPTEENHHFLSSHHPLPTNINEIQSIPLSMMALHGEKQETVLNDVKRMYYSTKKAKALIRHCLKN